MTLTKLYGRLCALLRVSPALTSSLDHHGGLRIVVVLPAEDEDFEHPRQRDEDHLFDDATFETDLIFGTLIATDARLRAAPHARTMMLVGSMGTGDSPVDTLVAVVRTSHCGPPSTRISPGIASVPAPPISAARVRDGYEEDGSGCEQPTSLRRAQGS
jgi:hypothetical protein